MATHQNEAVLQTLPGRVNDSALQIELVEANRAKTAIALFANPARSTRSFDLRGYVNVNQTLLAWVMRKFKHFESHKVRPRYFLQRLAAERESP